MVLQPRTQRQGFEQDALPHLDALYGMALRLAQDERDAEDLVQDALVKAFRFYSRYQQGTNFKAWLFKVLVNTFYNTCRKNRNILKVHAEAELDAHYEQFLSAASASGRYGERALLDRLAAGELQQALRELPEEFRVAVLLCDIYDFSYKEIADILNCPVGTVMSRLYRGRRLLQKKLYEYAREQGYIQAAEPAAQPAAQPAAPADLEAYRRQRGKL